MRNYVTTFDFSNSEMKLAINVNSPDGVNIEYKMSGWKIFGIIFGAVVGLGLIIWITCCCVKRYRKKKIARGYQTIGAGQHDGEIISEPPEVSPKYKQYYLNRSDSNHSQGEAQPMQRPH